MQGKRQWASSSKHKGSRTRRTVASSRIREFRENPLKDAE
jgi:hypothetical protein